MKRGTLVYPKHRLNPVDFLQFVELPIFSAVWGKLGLDDEDLLGLQILIMCHPRGFPVIPGTGGVRKMRFVPPGWEAGKRGALRVCYCHFPEFYTVVLGLVYPKGRKDTLSVSEKKDIKRAMDEIRKGLAR